MKEKHSSSLIFPIKELIRWDNDNLQWERRITNRP